MELNLFAYALRDYMKNEKKMTNDILYNRMQYYLMGLFFIKIII